jgi:glycosyltransferase involved in cell wall biosynthesis
MRYAWDEADYYLSEANFSTGIKGILARYAINYLRRWDLHSADNVNFFIANSLHIAKKIKRIYTREADVIYPPVDIKKFSVVTEKENYYLTASRLVPYKRIDLIVDAFARMPDKKLVVIGSGPEKEKIKSKSMPNINILGYQDFETLRNYMQKAKAFVFAAEEDFGIVPIEALSCGTPVIALNKGGAAETIQDEITGIHFAEQTVDALMEAAERFERVQKSFDPLNLHKYAEQFDRSVFEKNISNFVNQKAELFFGKDN